MYENMNTIESTSNPHGFVQLTANSNDFFPKNVALCLEETEEETLDSQLDQVEGKLDSLLEKQRKDARSFHFTFSYSSL